METFGIQETDWIRLQKEHAEWQDDLKALDIISLWPQGPPGFRKEYGQEEPKICLLPEIRQAKGIVLVCAGGAFHMKSVFEGRIVTERFAEHGYQGAVLDYRCRPYSIWQMLDDVQRAIRVLRLWGKKRGIENIMLCGFSAGGHLVSLAAVRYRNANLYVEDEADQMSSRPDAVIQCYGAIEYDNIDELLRENFTEEEKTALTPGVQIDENTPPFFMWMTREDEIIQRKVFFRMVEALEDAHVPYEVHIFQKGIHGIGLADGTSKYGTADSHAAQWMKLSCEWLERLN